jgi:hypothetical protein
VGVSVYILYQLTTSDRREPKTILSSPRREKTWLRSRPLCSPPCLAGLSTHFCACLLGQTGLGAVCRDKRPRAGLPTSTPNGCERFLLFTHTSKFGRGSLLTLPDHLGSTERPRVRGGSRPLLPNPMLLNGEGRTDSSPKDNSCWGGRGGDNVCNSQSKGVPVVIIASHKFPGDFWESFPNQTYV